MHVRRPISDCSHFILLQHWDISLVLSKHGYPGDKHFGELAKDRKSKIEKNQRYQQTEIVDSKINMIWTISRQILTR